MSIYTHSATQFDPIMVGGDVPVVLPDESLVDNTVTETPPADETEPTI